MSEELKKIIHTRRSIRWFKDQPIPKEDIIEIIQAGVRAPTASGGEQWYFMVVTNEEKRRTIHKYIEKGQMIYLKRMLRKKLGKEDLQKWKEWFKKGIYYAPLYIIGLINYNRRTLTDEYLDYEEQWGLQSVTLALGNMMLTAWAKGYGTVWIAVPQLLHEEFKEELQLPENTRYVGMLAIGPPAEMPDIRPRLPLEEVVFFT